MAGASRSIRVLRRCCSRPPCPVRRAPGRAGPAIRTAAWLLRRKIDISMLGMWYQVRQVEEKRMVTQNAAAAGPALPGGRVTEREAWSASGVPVLVLGVGMLLAGAALLVLGIVEGRGAGPRALVVAAVV